MTICPKCGWKHEDACPRIQIVTQEEFDARAIAAFIQGAEWRDGLCVASPMLKLEKHGEIQARKDLREGKLGKP